MEGMPTISEVLTSFQSVVSSVMAMALDILETMISNPITLIFLGVGIAFTVFGLAKKFIRVR